MTHWYLAAANWLDELPQDAVEQLRVAATVLELRHKETVFAPSPDPEDVFLLERGVVRIYRLFSSGEEMIFGFVEPGEVFGELAAIGEDERESFAEAVNACTVLKFPKDLFQRLMKSTPTLTFTVAKQIEKRFKRIESRAEDLVFRSAEARLAHILLRLAQDFGREDGGHTSISMRFTQSELGALIGVSRPTISITLREFRENGLLTVASGHLVLLKPEVLRTVAQLD